MLPSRGLRWSNQSLGLSRLRLQNNSSRPFSSLRHHDLPRSIPQLTSRHTLISQSHVRPILPKALLASQLSTIRFQSTSPNSTDSIPSASTSADISSDASASSLDPSLFDISQTDLLNVPEHIGYLKSLGLDYGWGPTAMMEWLLEHVHVYLGTPWWASITLTAILVRALLFRIYVSAADNAARLATVQHITKPLTVQMQKAQWQGNQNNVLSLRNEINRIHRKAGIKLYRSFVPMFQVFFGYGTFVLLRGMSKLPVPGLEAGGVLWFQNLAVPDPFLILPMGTAALIHLAIKQGSDTGVNNMSPAVTKGLAYGFPLLSLAFTWWLPAGLQLSFLCTSLFTYFQSTLFRQPKAREWLGMHPLPAPANDPFAAPKNSPYQDRVVVIPKDNYTSSSSSSGSSASASSSSSSAGRNVTYEPPRDTASSSSSGFSLGNLTKRAKDSMANISKSAAKSINEMTNKNEGRRTKAEQRQADKYEEQRQRQETERLLRLREQRNAERAAKLKERKKQSRAARQANDED